MTTAPNEAKLIRTTIEAVLAQTALPSLWGIVSDCSADDADNIVKKYCAKHSFIRLDNNNGRGPIAKAPNRRRGRISRNCRFFRKGR